MSRREFPRWLWIIPGLGGGRVAGWLLLGGWMGSSAGAWLSLLLVISFAGTALLLIVLGRPQQAPLRLGAAYLLIASAFAWQSPPETGPLRLLALSQPALFLPVFFWGVALALPRVSRIAGGRSRSRWVLALNLVACTALFLLDFRQRWAVHFRRAEPALFDAWELGWGFLYLSSGAALVFMVAQAGRARPEERRRASLLVAALLLGSTPALVGSAAMLALPPLRTALTNDPRLLTGYRIIAYGGLLAIPPATLYAVLARRALGLREVARVTLRSSLARHGVLAFTLLPFGLIVLLALRRVNGMGPLGDSPLIIGALAGLALLGVAALANHTRLLEVLDTRFFPEHRRREEALTRLERSLGSAPSLAELAGVIRVGLEGAVGFAQAVLLLRQGAGNRFAAVRGEAAPVELPAEALARLEQGETVRLTRTLASGISAATRWADSTGMELLAPVMVEGLRAVVAAGEKVSELPVTSDDESQVGRIAWSVARALARLEGGGSSAARPASTALECEHCREVVGRRAACCPECGGPLVPCPLPAVIVDKFSVQSLLGAGGMGLVYRAWDLDLERPVAVKTLPAADPERLDALRREGRFMARLNHSNLATVHGIETWSGRPVLVMELFERGSLAERLRRGPLPWRQAAAVGLQLARGVEHLHANRLLHLDIKPSNVGVAADGTVKLLDFGLARIGWGGERADSICGTVEYMSPEVLLGEAPGTRADLWALAVTLYEALTGRRPFCGATPHLVIGRIASGVPPKPVQVGAQRVPDPLAKLVDRSLSRNPAQRVRSATELVESLQAMV